MTEEQLLLLQLVDSDGRYPFDAYVFAKDGLTYAVEALDMGGDSAECASRKKPNDKLVRSEKMNSGDTDDDSSDGRIEKHLTGQQFCEALRRYAVHQYGFMAKVVLANWGIHRTSDFGEIVFSLIDVGLMKKSSDDQRTHFNDVFDFDEAFDNQFQINQPAVFWPG